jgi:hypothetical protein
MTLYLSAARLGWGTDNFAECLFLLAEEQKG